jgi:hypothetical protein
MKRHLPTVIAGFVIIMLLSTVSSASSVASYPLESLLNSVTFWESTTRTPYPFNFNASSPAMLTRLNNPLGNTNNDFWGVVGSELYDVFYSNANGTFNALGQYITIEAVWPFVNGGGGLNICEVDLNFKNGITDHANYVASFFANGTNALPNSVYNAIDGNLNTCSTLGNTYNTSDRLRLTLGYISPSSSTVPLPPTVIIFGSGLLGLLGLRRRIL